MHLCMSVRVHLCVSSSSPFFLSHVCIYLITTTSWSYRTLFLLSLIPLPLLSTQFFPLLAFHCVHTFHTFIIFLRVSTFFFFPLRKKGQHNTEEDSQYSSSVRVFFVVVVYLHDLVPFLFGVRAVTASHAWIFWFWFFFCRVVSAFVICP